MRPLPDEPTFAPLARLLLDNVVAESIREIDGPHVVILRDPASGATSFQGPFPDGLTALLIADAEDPALEAAVAPLLAPA